MRMEELVKITPRFVDVDPIIQAEVQKIVDKNLAHKMHSYLRQFVDSNPDVEIVLYYDFQQNKKGKYDGSFRLNVNGQDYNYHREDFTDPVDLVNHAFDHFKLHLSDPH